MRCFAATGHDEWLEIVRLMDFLNVIGGTGRSLTSFFAFASTVGEGIGMGCAFSDATVGAGSSTVASCPSNSLRRLTRQPRQPVPTCAPNC